MALLWVAGQLAMGTGTVPLAQGPPRKLCVCIQCLDWAHTGECEWSRRNLMEILQDHPEGGRLEKEVTATVLETLL